jgi:hypothetical protein
LRAACEKDPVSFCRIAATLVPKEVEATATITGIRWLSEEEWISKHEPVLIEDNQVETITDSVGEGSVEVVDSGADSHDEQSGEIEFVDQEPAIIAAKAKVR